MVHVMKDAIIDAINAAIKTLDLPVVDFVVDYPTDKNAEADYFSNIGLVLAKQVGENPRAVAERLQGELAGKVDQVEAITVAGPGFLNFTLKREYFKANLEAALAAGDNWGKNSSWQDKLVIVEYTDPNPFKELHIGHLVPNALGESLSRLFMMSGADTKRVTFQGDVGMHVAKALYGLRQMNVVAADITAAILGQAYATGSQAFESSEDIQTEIKALNKIIYKKQNLYLIN